MKISTKGRYALRMMMDLAQHSTGSNIALRDISGRQEISIKYLEQITTQLCKAGFLRSVRGPLGGYRLTRNPSEYTVGSILRVTEGNLAPVACLEHQPNICPRVEECSTIQFWTGLQKVIDEYVDNVTLADLLESNGHICDANYVI